ncbi:MAG TPA: glycosyltransferase family 2 protein [Xanthomonadaceae bacterium]|nr:glycosyltransferase family 2 protein [Xanthomonadaceae bacterium]
MSAQLPLSGVVIAKNEAGRIGRCVASMARVCSEVWVLDSDSTDATAAEAEAAGAKVRQQEWLGFSAQKNAAIALATQPWVLLLDADEWLGEGAEAALSALFDERAVERADVWELERRTHFLGTELNHGGWGREGVERLFRNDLLYLPADVHEKLDLRGRRVSHLRARIEHDTARSLEDYRGKLARYAVLWAQQKYSEGRRANALAAPLHAASYWLKNYLLCGGFLDGAMARSYHACHARYVFEKYRALRSQAKP